MFLKEFKLVQKISTIVAWWTQNETETLNCRDMCVNLPLNVINSGQSIFVNNKKVLIE